MTWQRRLRLLLAVTAVACAVAVFMLRRERPEPGAPPSGTTRDPSAIMEMGAGIRRLFSGQGSQDDPRYTYESLNEYPGGRIRATGVHVVFENDGLEVWADLLEYQADPTGRPGAATLTGNVRVRDAGGLELQSADATYDGVEDVLSMPGDVTFASGRMSGRSVGAVFNRTQQIARLLAEPEVLVDVEGETGTTVATAATMTLAQVEGFARLEGEAVIQRPAETLAADTATIYMTEGQQDVRLVDLSGNARVTPDPDAEGASPSMAGETISLAFHEGGTALERATLTNDAHLALATGQVIDALWIDLGTGADGRTITRLVARDRVVVDLPADEGAPARRITAGDLVASGDDVRGLTTARFDENVVFAERQPGEDQPREGRGASLLLGLDGELSSIRQAEFRGAASFVAGDVTGQAELAIYRLREGRLELRPTGSTDPPARVTNDALTVDARLIDLWVDDDRLEATGDVVTVSAPDEGRDGGSGFFDAGEQTIGTSRQFFYDGGAGEARWVGVGAAPARLTNGSHRVVEALEIVLGEESGDLMATEGVNTTGVLENADAEQATPTSYRIESDRLAYVGDRRTAEYSGAEVRLTADDMSSSAAHVTLELAEDRDALVRIVWDGDVHATLEGGYEAAGSRLEYLTEDARYILDGVPARLKAQDASGCTLAEGAHAVITPDGTPPIQWPGARNQPGRVQSRPVDCSVPLR